MKTTEKKEEIIAIFLEKGVALDYETTNNKDYYRNDELMNEFKLSPYNALFYFGFAENNTAMSASLSFLHGIAQKFIHSLSKNADIEITREAVPITIEELWEILNRVPFAVGVEFININWIKMLWGELSAAFSREIANFDGTVAEFLTAHNAAINVVGRVFFHLVENKEENYPFAFLATYSTGNPQEKKASHLPLKNALLEYGQNQELLLKLLSTVSKAADKSDFISEMVESGELFSPLKFTADDAYVFLKEVQLYEECGILCRIPDWWKKKSNTFKVSVAIGGEEPSQVGMEAILSFDPAIYLGDEEITKEEINILLAQTAGLSFLKGKWVEVDQDKLKQVLAAYEEANTLEGMTFAEAMRLQLGLNKKELVSDDESVEVTNGAWLNSVRNRLLAPGDIKNLSAGAEFKATLRQYQQSGFGWLAAMQKLGFGALLADDMGLGKTVQILAFLEHLRQKGSLKSLLIIPASLIGNWQKEIEKFAPSLSYAVLHNKKTDLDLNAADLFITTYGMAMRLESLHTHKWDLVILDEAQAIKNPGTKQTRAVKKIPCYHRIAMTGTPIENRLSDLWSLFDFLNPGLLGTAKEFGTFTKQMQSNGFYSKLRGVVGPFILRRLKTDKTIIDDLPDKIEIKSYAALTKKQVVLYNALVRDLTRKLTDAEGIARKGLVLAAIVKFKQICNHPDQYLGQSAFDHEHSGKFVKLAEICETIHEKRERMLVFTQFKEMTEPLAKYLETIFNREGLVLHGGIQVKKRTALVDKFNGEDYIPFMVLSLKAGGVGLNLTGANHVVHFDRWWNPAVENQATDRAFRIGQEKNVIVHKFITTGTIEEKIDSMIEEKIKLADNIIAGSGENWITEMSNEELIKLFTLA